MNIRRFGERLAHDQLLPEWLRPLVNAVDGIAQDDFLFRAARFESPPTRRSAVLALFGEGTRGPDVLLTARAETLRSHAGQPAFPGGREEPGEDSVTTALREANEETGLDPASVVPAALLPDLYLAYSGFQVSPVVGFWRSPGPVQAVDPAETAAVVRVPIADLTDPELRGSVRHPSGFLGPAFEVAGLVVWGFTAGVLDALLRLGGWHRPWNSERWIELPSQGRRLVDPEAGHLSA